MRWGRRAPNFGQLFPPTSPSVTEAMDVKRKYNFEKVKAGHGKAFQPSVHISCYNQEQE